MDDWGVPPENPQINIDWPWGRSRRGQFSDKALWMTGKVHYTCQEEQQSLGVLLYI